MLMDVTEYMPENMKEEDKRVYEELENAKERVLSDSSIDEYLNEKCQYGCVTSKVLKELLEPFIGYLRHIYDYHMLDFTVDCIDGYDDAEVESLKAKQPKGVVEV